MASLFQGTPQTATSYTTSSTETPKWLQDAIYNQIQWAQQTANTPFVKYSGDLVAGLTPEQQQAYQQVRANQGAFMPQLQQAQAGTAELSKAPGGLSAAQPYIQQAAGMSGLSAAQPYMQQAAATSPQDIQQFLNPYTEAVTNQIAKLGARNLTENLLPNVSDTFIRAGQFGSGRMGEFGSRALRDTQEAILNQQSQALQSGYGQALSAAQQEAARQAQLASTAGGLTQQQQQLLASLGSQAGQLTTSDLARQQSALQQMASMAQQGQAMSTADVAALEAAGQAQQAQQQRQLESQYQQFQLAQQYPKSQLDWLNAQIRGMAPSVPTTQTATGQTTGATYSPSPLSQLAQGYFAYKGLSSI